MKSAEQFLAEKGIFSLDTKKRTEEVYAWMEEYAQQFKQPVESNKSIDEALVGREEMAQDFFDKFYQGKPNPFYITHFQVKQIWLNGFNKQIIRNASAMTGKEDNEILKDAEAYANKIDKENGRVTTPTWNLIYSAYADGQKDLLKNK